MQAIERKLVIIDDKGGRRRARQPVDTIMGKGDAVTGRQPAGFRRHPPRIDRILRRDRDDPINPEPVGEVDRGVPAHAQPVGDPVFVAADRLCRRIQRGVDVVVLEPLVAAADHVHRVDAVLQQKRLAKAGPVEGAVVDVRLEGNDRRPALVRADCDHPQLRRFVKDLPHRSGVGATPGATSI